MLKIVLMLIAAYCALNYAGIMCACLAFGILPVGVVMCARAVEHDEAAFSGLSVDVSWRERLAR